MSVDTKPYYFIEVAEERRNDRGSCGVASLRDASPEEVVEFMSQPCDHQRVELLCYDVPAYAWDIRHCAVCHSIIGMI